MPAINLYHMDMSPTSRAIRMLAQALNVELNLITVNTMAGDQMAPEYIKMNPQHTIPTIKDGDFVLWETRAILGYLVNKYAKDDKFYPTDAAKRAVVDQRLYFDMGTLNLRYGEYIYPQFRTKAPADPEKYQKIEEAIGFLNTFLDGHKYAAGEEITIADFALVATVSTIVDGGLNLSLEKYPNVQRWYEDCKENVPHYKDSIAGLEKYKGLVAEFLNKEK